jgi:hypothetical protein
MYFYEIGSVTPKDTYLDAELTIPATNPVLLNADGRLPDTYLLGSYRTMLSEPSTGQIWERDNVGSEFSEGYGSEWNSTVTYNIPDVVLYNGRYYQSLTNNNLNNAPDSSSANWVRSGSVITTVITSSVSAWSPSPLTTSIEFIAIGGGGGGGGGGSGGGGGLSSASSGGGGGGYSSKTSNNIDDAYSIIIGVGGNSGNPSGNGGAGGTTSITSSSILISCSSAQGGEFCLATAVNKVTVGASGGSAVGGDVNIRGGDATSGIVVGGDIASGSLSGVSVFGGAVRAAYQAAGSAGLTYGCGGGSVTTQDVGAQSGGAGANGVVIIKEHI